MQQFLPTILKLYYKLAADPKFKQLVVDVIVVESQWLSGELDGQAALDQIIQLAEAYFMPPVEPAEPEFKAL